MKIVHVSHLYYPSKGGVQTFFKNVSERLVRDYNDDVTVVTTNSYFGPERKEFKEITPSEETINGVKIKRFTYIRWHIPFYAIFFKMLGKLSIAPPRWMIKQATGPVSSSMKKYLTTVNADAICGSSSNYHYMQLPLWKRCNFFYYGSIHLPQNEKKQALYPSQIEAINASTLYLANTNYEKHRLEKNGIKPEKLFVLGTGVNMEDFIVSPPEIETLRQQLQIPSEAVIAAYIGRLEKTKNVLLVIQSFEKLAAGEPDLFLLIAGSGSNYAHTLQQYCAQLPPAISARIKWQIDFSTATKAALFNLIDILILPSHNESFGLVFLEAWSCKKPVIGAAIGAVKDVINENEDGLLMNPDDADSLAEQLKKLVDNKALREKLGRKGYEKVSKHYTWDIITARLRTCYLNGLKQKKEENFS